MIVMGILSVAERVSFNRDRSDLQGFTLTQKPTVRIKSAWSVLAK